MAEERDSTRAGGTAVSAPAGRVREVFGTFLRLGLTSFGGPVAHLGHFQRELVARRAWVNEGEFAQWLALCQFLPGPASSQLGFVLGVRRAGWLGGLAAFVAFTTPSALLLAAFAAWRPDLAGGTAAAVVHGLKLVAVAVVAHAIVGMARALHRARSVAVAPLGDPLPLSPRMGWALVAVALALVAMLPWLATRSGAPAFQALAGMLRAGGVVYGGGHVVLPLLEHAVTGPGLLSRDTFLAGYGAAQAVPGPLFSLASYLGALLPHDGGVLGPWGAMAGVAAIFAPGLLLAAGAMPLWAGVLRRAAASRVIPWLHLAVLLVLAAAFVDPVWRSAVRGPADMLIAAVGFGALFLHARAPLGVVLWCVGASVVLG